MHGPLNVKKVFAHEVYVARVTNDLQVWRVSADVLKT
jgi:hypothetical protein